MFAEAVVIAAQCAAMQNVASTPAQRHKWMMDAICDKETNMKTRLERRRAAIRWKWINRFVVISAAMFAIPLVLAALNFCWSLVLG